MESFTGVVQKGSARAKALGYPTINIPLEADASGVFVAIVRSEDDEWFAAAFADPSRKLLEAHILDFDEDLYGKEVSIELLKKLRESKRFDDDASLRDAIAEDLRAVREYLGL